MYHPSICPHCTANTLLAQAFPLMQWIVNSNASHIVLLEEAQRIKSMGTPHQFLMLSAPPERERRFSELRSQHGSEWARLAVCCGS